MNKWNDWCFRLQFCTVRLHWAGDNLSEWDEFCDESCPWRRIDCLTCWPACYHYTTDTRCPNYYKNFNISYLHHLIKTSNTVDYHNNHTVGMRDQYHYIKSIQIPNKFFTTLGYWFTTFEKLYQSTIKFVITRLLQFYNTCFKKEQVRISTNDGNWFFHNGKNCLIISAPISSKSVVCNRKNVLAGGEL